MKNGIFDSYGVLNRKQMLIITKIRDKIWDGSCGFYENMHESLFEFSEFK